jgi:O-methyltransferase
MASDAIELYLNLLEEVLLDSVHQPQRNDNYLVSQDQVEDGSYWPLRAHTMIGRKRLKNIRECYENVIKNNIPGDLIETGVWRGGACIYMNALNKIYGQKRRVFVADSFEGLPVPDSRYPADSNDIHHTIKFLAVSLEEVMGNFKRYNLLDDNVVFVKGFFEHSIPMAPIDKLSILRLDGDMYSSTIQVLDLLYDKLSIGGYIIIDDYALPGCKKAVDDFRRNHNITTTLIIVDFTGVYWQ